MQKLAASILLTPFFVSTVCAEVALLDDSTLASHSGQAGLTIDTSSLTKLTEFEYLDSDMFTNPAIKVGGHGNNGHPNNTFYTDQLDNLRVNISIQNANANTSEEGHLYGFAQFRDLAKTYLENGNTMAEEDFKDLAEGKDPRRNHLEVDDKQYYEEGDLIIHYAYLDPWEKDGGQQAYANGSGLSGKNFVNASYEDAENLVNRAVDFKYSINEIGLAFDGAQLGQTAQTNKSLKSGLSSSDSSGSTSTTLMSNFSIQGYLGPHDLHIKAFKDDSHNLNDNGITWNSYFKVTDLDVYLDLSGIQISNLQIHNNRGDLSGLNLDTQDNSVGNSSFGFAHAEREIYSMKEAVLDVIGAEQGTDKSKKKTKKDAIAFNTRFKGDLDIQHFSFGDTGESIGEFFITDMYFNSRLTITPR